MGEGWGSLTGTGGILPSPVRKEEEWEKALASSLSLVTYLKEGKRKNFCMPF